MDKKRFYIELMLKLLGIFIIGIGIYEIPHKLNIMIEKFITKVSDTNFSTAVLLVFIGLIVSLLVRIYFYFRSMEKYQILYSLSFVCFIIFCIIFIWKDNTFIQQIFFSMLLVGAYCLYTKGIDCKIKEQESANNSLDQSITLLTEDKLGRINTAKRIAEVLKVHKKKNLKIGVYGKWGTGKTSLMNLVKKSLDEEFIVCWFNPWTYHSDKDLWIGFRKAIEQTLISHSKGIRNFSVLRTTKTFAMGFFQQSTSKLPIGKLIDDLIKNAGTPVQDEIKASINNYLNRVLPENTKIIVFIDDLDRLDDAKRILTILKTVKEIVNIDKISYVLAIDDETISKIIAREMNLTNGHLFLEKIIDYHITIDAPSNEGLTNLLEQELNNPESEINISVIDKIKEYLPSNPRTLKRYLQNMQLLSPIFKQFEDEEINLNFIYLAQLLKLEFPNIYTGILRDQNIMELFSNSHKFSQAFAQMYPQSSKKVDDVQKIIETYHIEPKYTVRVGELVTGIQKQLKDTDNDVALYFRILETSDVLTWKKYKEIHEILILDITKFDELLDRNLQKRYIEKVFAQRGDLLAKSVRTKYQDTALNHQQELMNLDNHIREIINLAIPENQIRMFELLYYQLKSWIRFNDGPYSVIRKSEKEMIEKLIEILVNSHYNELLQILEPWRLKYSHFDDKEFPGFKDYRQYLFAMVEPVYVQKLVNRFTLKSGLHIWLNNRFETEKYYLFQKSLFHEPEIYTQLDILAEKAKDDLIIRENFFEYIELFNYYLSEEGSIHGKSEGIKEILKNIEFLRILWKGVTSHTIHLSAFPTLKKFIELVRDFYDTDVEEILSYPDWWEEKEIEYLSLKGSRN
ncbi:KAP family P-loop NTPase fold protein [Bacillus wiedmannii]|uniref:KAP family P-loop NTPase fold protein n=1 Tax=Bacillus wiedmannii TaxID=1890302 RepID=UPI0020D22136|nr:P-loop NTPase fold protein [Bacillus wiedmannii]